MMALVAVVMEALSALMVAALGAITASPFVYLADLPEWYVATLLLGGWALSTWGVWWNAASALQAARRGTLLGALEWLIMVPASLVAGFYYGADEISHRMSEASSGAVSDADKFAAHFLGTFGGVAFSFIAACMFVVCLLAYLVLGLMEREVTPAPPRQYPPNPFSSKQPR